MGDWYLLNNIKQFDSPCLVIYKERVLANIRKAISKIGDVSLLRPHVKTNKIAEVCRMMMNEGISKFKCATIAEAEMLAQINAPDVMLAYQPVGPKAQRLLHLIQLYPATKFSCVLDNVSSASSLSALFEAHGVQVNVYIDLNTGMNRTGADARHMYALADHINTLPGLKLVGLHAYDGHVRDTNINTRQHESDEAYKMVILLRDYIESKHLVKLTTVVGGSPSFATHVHRKVECSPGTFVFWDWGYHKLLPDEPYLFAAVLVTRVLSVIDAGIITTDLGYKSVAAENPLPRVHFLNAGSVTQLSQSEEHLVLHIEDGRKYSPGEILYGVPNHVCPTVALYDEVLVAEHNRVVESWRVTARGRKISV